MMMLQSRIECVSQLWLALTGDLSETTTGGAALPTRHEATTSKSSSSPSSLFGLNHNNNNMMPSSSNQRKRRSDHPTDTSGRPLKTKTIVSLLIIYSSILLQLVAAAEQCQSYGCLLKPIDVVDEGPETTALNILRRHLKENNDVKDEKSDILNEEEKQRLRLEALQTLQIAGDETKTTMTLKGHKGGPQESQINQDRAIIISPFHVSTLREKQKENNMTIQLLAVFDGHGNKGELTSQHAIDTLPPLLANKLAGLGEKILEEEDAVVQILKDVFNEVDKTDPTNGDAGCTATVILQLGPKLYIANAGDSVSFVGVHFPAVQNAVQPGTAPQHEVHIVYQSREDKPDLPDERARIMAAGGYVHIPSDPNDDVPRAYHVDKDGRMRWGLAMSRSLGDWYVQGVIAEPIVDVLHVNDIITKALSTHADTTCSPSENIIGEQNGDGDKGQYCDALDPRDVSIFAISASDGMMDELTPHYIGSIMAESFFDNESTVHPHSAAEHLVIQAAKGWHRFGQGYRDDIAISAAIIPLDNEYQ
jgi:serine/threonine protein phosphatase PrpC